MFNVNQCLLLGLMSMMVSAQPMIPAGACNCNNPTCQPKCTFGLQSWGLHDTKGGHIGYIDINYKTIVNTTGVVTSGGTGSSAPATQGIHVVAVDPLTCAQQGSSESYNVAQSSPFSIVELFITYINGRANGTVLLVATAGDVHTNLSPAYDTIKNIGGPDLSDTTTFGPNGKFAFVVEIGYPSKGKYAVNSGKKPLDLNVVMSGLTQDGVYFTTTG